MQERNKNKKGLHYEQKDILNLEYKKEIFDLIIDKVTMDTILCTDNALLNITKMTKEISRSLKTGGTYLILSYGKPNERLIHLKREHLAFDIKIIKITKSEKNGKINYNMNIIKENEEEINDNNNKEKEEKKVHYAYLCKKLPEANEKLNNFRNIYNEMKEYLNKEKEEIKEKEENSNDNSDIKDEIKDEINNKETKKKKKDENNNENNNENKEKEEAMDIEDDTREEKKNIEIDEESIEQFFSY